MNSSRRGLPHFPPFRAPPRNWKSKMIPPPTPLGPMTYQLLPAAQITTKHMKDAAELFSTHYGVWGPRGVNPGEHVHMSSAFLRGKLVPMDHESDFVCVRATRRRVVGNVAGLRGVRGYVEQEEDLVHERQLVGNVFASVWRYREEGMEVGKKWRAVLWVTQMVVHREWRARGIAKATLSKLRDHFAEQGVDIGWFGIMSSHPFAVLAFKRVFGSSPDFPKLGAPPPQLPTLRHDISLLTPLIASSPVPYIRAAKIIEAKTRFGFGVKQGSKSGMCHQVDTDFHVDHSEIERALRELRWKGGWDEWVWRELEEGCEFVCVMEAPAPVKVVEKKAEDSKKTKEEQEDGRAEVAVVEPDLVQNMASGPGF